MDRLRGWQGLGNTALGWLVEASMWAYYFAWVFPRWVYLHWSGQIPRAPLGTRLPIRLRERGWCMVCQRTLDDGAVRCPAHPNGEVMLVLRDEGESDAS